MHHRITEQVSCNINILVKFGLFYNLYILQSLGSSDEAKSYLLLGKIPMGRLGEISGDIAYRRLIS